MGGLLALDYLAVSHVSHNITNISDPQGGALKLEVQGKHKTWNRGKNNEYIYHKVVQSSWKCRQA